MVVMPPVIRVYVCALISDTRGERAVLEAAVFPQLRERLASHGVALETVFADLDVQTDGTIASARLASDFKAIDECRPFFVAILGERYGCPPDAIPTGLLREQRWLLDYAERSSLELEIQHGVLNDPPAAGASHFYFREPRAIFGVPDLDRASLLEGNPESAQRLADLKQRIRRIGRPIMDNYPCRWDAESRQMGELDAFAERVQHDLCAAIAAEFPELAHSLTSALPPSAIPSETKADQARYVDEDVQFTVFRPKRVRPEEWYDLVAAAHLEEKRETAEEDEPDPLDKVRRKATRILGAQMADYKEVSRDSMGSVPRGGEITFLFEMNQVEFNPSRCTFQWLEDEHTVDVRMRASQALDGQTATGQMSVFLGAILLADVSLKIKVDSRYVSTAETPTPEPVSPVSARPYRKIFASYSHKDRMIVEQFEHFADALGDRYLRDWKDLRAGENWDARLMQLIDEADVFQLFWSCHAMESDFVRREWQYALGLGRPNFVRPIYWEDPFPRRPGLPPADLGRLHFQQLASTGRADTGIHLTGPSDSGIDLDGELLDSADSSPSSLELADVDEVALDGSSGDSGIDLTSDSGLNLEEEPLDLGGSSVSSLELPADDDSIDLDDLDGGSDAPLQADEDFSLSPSPPMADEEAEEGGSRVIALEDSEAFEEAATVLASGEGSDEVTAAPAAYYAPRNDRRDWIYVLATAVIMVGVLAFLAWLFIFRTAQSPTAAKPPAPVLEQPQDASPSPTADVVPNATTEAAAKPETAVQEEPPLTSLTSISAAVGDRAAYRRELLAYLDRHPGSKRSADFQGVLDDYLPLLDELIKWQDMVDRWSELDMRVVTPNQAASMASEADSFLQDFGDLPQMDQVRGRLPFLEAIAGRVDAEGQSIVTPLMDRFQDSGLAVLLPGAMEMLSEVEDRSWESTFFRVLRAVSEHPQLPPSRRLQAMKDVLRVAAGGSLPMRNGFSPHLAMLDDFPQPPGLPASSDAEDAAYEKRCSAVLAALPSMTEAAGQAAAQYHSLQYFPRAARLRWAGWLGRDEHGAWQCLLSPEVAPTAGRLMVFYRTAPGAAWSMIQVGAITDATPTLARDRMDTLIEGLPVVCDTDPS